VFRVRLNTPVAADLEELGTGSQSDDARDSSSDQLCVSVATIVSCITLFRVSGFGFGV
jgi:hypothetical protein